MSLCTELEGKKTYTVAFLVAGLAVAYANGFVDQELYTALLTALNAAGLATLRAGINNSTEEKTNEVK